MACRVCKSQLIVSSSAAGGSSKVVESRGDGQPTFYSGGVIYCPSCGIRYLFDPDGDTLELLYAYDGMKVTPSKKG